MAFTDNADLFASVDEDGINLVVRHVMRQRPSLVNYGTAWVAAAPSRRLCRPIEVAPDVISRQNPLLTVMDPISIPITNDAYALDFCAQVTDAQTDLHPADVVTLPPELGSLPDQRLAVRGRACVGLGCPDAGTLAGLPAPPAERPAKPTVLHPADDAMTCFCLEFFAVAGVAITGTGQLQVTATLDKVEIVDLAPAGLESIVKCALHVLIVVGLLPSLRVAVGTLLLDLLAQLPGVVLPSRARQRFRTTRLSRTIGSSSSSTSRCSHEPSRHRHVRGGRQGVVRGLPQPVHVRRQQQRQLRAIHGQLRRPADLEDGSVELNDDNTISISELDIKWDRLQLCIGVDIPGFCIGGFCIIPIPFDGCLVRAPELCLFRDNPDLEFCLDLSGVITSEVSARVQPLVRYRVDPNRTPP